MNSINIEQIATNYLDVISDVFQKHSIHFDKIECKAKWNKKRLSSEIENKVTYASDMIGSFWFIGDNFSQRQLFHTLHCPCCGQYAVENIEDAANPAIACRCNQDYVIEILTQTQYFN
jgi:hypothetical protein